MSAARAPAIPPLGGLCSYAEAARIGYSVDENVRRLLRYHWTEKRLMEILVERIPSTPEWEVKGALALHQWLDSQHADALRERITEMRHPVPRMDVSPDPALEALLAEVAAAEDTVELLTGTYGVVRASLAEAYRIHLAETNPLVDHPTRRVLLFARLEEEEATQWGEAALAALLEGKPEARERQAAWRTHLEAYLVAAGGIAGPPRSGASLPAARARSTPPPDFHPRRDERFTGRYNFNFPPHVLCSAPNVPADERNLALLCKRLLEMDVPEMMASFMTELRHRPWEFHRDYARQLWDEARHSMLGEAALEARGVEWTRIPLNVGFALRLNLHADPFERQVMLWAIEQSLMPGDTGKRSEYETAREAGDALSAHFHDYDWADEVLHARIGRRWVTAAGLSVQEAMEQGRAVHERTWRKLERYRDREPQAEWWSAFVRRVLGKDTAATPDQLVEDPAVITE